MEYLTSAARASGGGGSGAGRTGLGMSEAAAARAGSLRRWLSVWAIGCAPHPAARMAIAATAANEGPRFRRIGRLFP